MYRMPSRQQRCWSSAMLRCPTPVSFSPLHQLADMQHNVEKFAKTHHSFDLPDVATSHGHIPRSLPHRPDQAHSMQDIVAEDCPNEDELLPMRKRPFRAVGNSEVPTTHTTKCAASPQHHSQCLTTPREAFDRQCADGSSAMASHARHLSASQEAQPSKRSQIYNSVAMDPGMILQQAGAIANAAEATSALSYQKTPLQAQAATETRAQTHGPTCTQTCFPTDTQRSRECFSLSSAPCDVGIETKITDFHDASYCKQQATAVPKSQTQAQQNI